MIRTFTFAIVGSLEARRGGRLPNWVKTIADTAIDAIAHQPAGASRGGVLFDAATCWRFAHYVRGAWRPGTYRYWSRTDTPSRRPRAARGLDLTRSTAPLPTRQRAR
jgi:hypothetical protein